MNTYTIIIDEQQREVLKNALACYICCGLANEVDSEGLVVAPLLKDMLLADNLNTTGVNNFVP